MYGIKTINELTLKSGHHFGHLHVPNVGSFKEEEGRQKSTFKVREGLGVALLMSVKTE